MLLNCILSALFTITKDSRGGLAENSPIRGFPADELSLYEIGTHHIVDQMDSLTRTNDLLVFR